MNQYKVAAHTFETFEDVPFSPTDYSNLKFGCDLVAQRFGEQLADTLFHQFKGELLSRPCVVIPSPYNHVMNAASNMSRFMVDRLNLLIVTSGGMPLTESTVHRRMTYVNDYGFLDAATREKLLSNDEYFVNQQFLTGKMLICVDDIRITGTHERKMAKCLTASGLNTSDVVYAYYGMLTGNRCQPDVEARLNLHSVNTPEAFAELTAASTTSVLVRPIKRALALHPNDFHMFVSKLPRQKVHTLFYGAIAEGYYKLPAYQPNFTTLRQTVASTL